MNCKCALWAREVLKKLSWNPTQGKVKAMVGFLVILSNLNIYNFALGWHHGFGGVNLVCEEGEVFYGAGLKPNAELKW